MDQKAMFYYMKHAKRRGIEGLFIVPIFLVLFGGILLYIYLEKHINLNQFLVLAVILLVFFVAMFFWSYILFKNTGKWEISVSPTEIIWHAPTGIGEASFHLHPNEIIKVVNKYGVDANDHFYLFLKDQREIYLKPDQSGVNIHKFVNQLEELGVEYEFIPNQ